MYEQLHNIDALLTTAASMLEQAKIQSRLEGKFGRASDIVEAQDALMLAHEKLDRVAQRLLHPPKRI